MYLGSSYDYDSFVENRYEMDKYVLYYLSGYPDVLDKYAVTHIEIKDPNVTVYGLTSDSDKITIEKTMVNIGFKKVSDTSYLLNNVTFSFGEGSIIINAKVTNKNNIVF